MNLLSNISNALLHSIWQFFILLLCYYVFAYLVKNKKVVYVFAVVLKIVGFAWFATTTFISQTPIYSLSSEYSTPFFFDYIGYAYLLVVGLLQTQLIFRISYLKTKIKTSFVYENLGDFYNIIKTYIPEKKIIITISTSITSPITYGFIKPVIVLPFALCNTLSAKEMEMVLLHEVAHIIRKDYIIHLLIKIIDAFLFFNPFSILLSKAIEQEREFCCDDWVLQQKPEHYLYAHTLFNVAKQQQTLQKLVLAQAFAQPQYLLERIKRVTTNKSHFNKLSIKQTILLSVALCMSILVNKTKDIEHESQTHASKNVFDAKNITLPDKIHVATTNSKPVNSTTNTKRRRNDTSLKTKGDNTTKYSAEDRQRLKDGFQFLSELAKENIAVKQIVESNPSMQVVDAKEQEFSVTNAVNTKPSENSRFFYIPATKTSKAKLVTVTVVENDKNNKKVVIEVEEIDVPSKS